MKIIETINLCYITHPSEKISITEQVEAVCKGGAKYIQLRMKGYNTSEIIAQAKQIKPICKQHNALLIINDHIEVAKTVDADGVHIGKEDVTPQEARRILGQNKIIGATCNTIDDILEVTQQPIDYIGLGPFRYTTTKAKLSPVLGIEGYTNIMTTLQKQGIDLPVFAIGGITTNDISSIMATGVNGIAVSGVIKNSDNIELTTANLIEKLTLCKH